MDLEYGERYEGFRKEVRAFLAEHADGRPRGNALESDKRATAAWLSKQIEHGYWARTIPREYGGYGAEPDLLETVIMDEEFNRAHVARGSKAQGPSMLVPTLLAHGTEEQKQQYIAPTLRGEIVWCQGYSEPGAGSDLASLQTSAVEDDDDFLINGQKIWTSYADKADWIFCLTRTDKNEKHKGISFMLFDMASEGVTTKPIVLISGQSAFCETFFDDVKVPKSYGEGVSSVVFEVNRGWDVAKYLLGHERSMISGGGSEGATSLGAKFADQYGRDDMGRLDDPMLRAQMADMDIEVLAFRAMAERFGDTFKAGLCHPAQPNMMKYAGTEINKRRHELIMSAGGSEVLEWESEATNGGLTARSWLRTKANSIEGGTSEVMLNVVSKQILQLPGA